MILSLTMRGTRGREAGGKVGGKAGRPATGGVLSGLRMTWQEAFSSRDEAIAWTRESGPLDRKFTNMVV